MQGRSKAMARNRRSNRNVQSNYKSRKDDRTYVAIISKNKLVGIWTGAEESSKYVAAPNDRDTRLGALRLLDEVLDSIPTNDELLDKQVAIYGINCLTDCFTKPGDIIRSSEVSAEAKEMIPEIAQKLFDRSYNCFLVDTRHSNATIVKDGFDWLQDVTEKNNGAANGVEYTDRPKSNASAEVKSPLQVQQEKLNAAYDELDAAYDADDEAKAAKLESKIERLKARIADLQAMQSVQAQA